MNHLVAEFSLHDRFLLQQKSKYHWFFSYQSASSTVGFGGMAVTVAGDGMGFDSGSVFSSIPIIAFFDFVFLTYFFQLFLANSFKVLRSYTVPYAMPTRAERSQRIRRLRRDLGTAKGRAV